MKQLGTRLCEFVRSIYYTDIGSMGLPFAKVLNALVAKTSPEIIYRYQKPPSIKFGSLALALVFITYGATFGNWAYESSLTVYSEADDETKKDWKFLGKTFCPMALTIIPFSLAIGAAYAPSRIVTQVKYVPKLHGKPECQLTRQSFISGKSVHLTRPINELIRNDKTRVFTGEGEQGVEDKGSFIFILTDRNTDVKNWFDKFYLLPRSGRFWASDGRIFDALFGGDSIRDLELKTKNLVNKKSLKDIKQDRSMLDEMIEKNSRAKFHSGSKGEVQTSKNIVGKVEKRPQL